MSNFEQFSMKQLATLIRARSVGSTVYSPSGFREGTFEASHIESGHEVKETWRVRELLSEKDLFLEGQRMSHCVSSYGHRVAQGLISIWSMTMTDARGPTGSWAMLTIEVNNQNRQVVQARGQYNRAMTGIESQMLNRWAVMNGLSLSLSRW